MCASFVGEEAEIQALTLARELRTSLRGNAGLDAFIYRHRFDFSDSLEGIGYDTTEGTRLADGSVIAKRKQMTANNADAFEEIAVVVGAFPTVEDARAQQTLQQIKYMMPQSLGKVSPVITRTKSNIKIDFGDFIFSSRVNFGPFRRGRYQNGAIGSSPNL